MSTHLRDDLAVPYRQSRNAGVCCEDIQFFGGTRRCDGAPRSTIRGQAQPSVRLAVTGETNLRASFIESFKEAGREAGVAIEVVPRSDDTRTFLVIIAQESTLGSAAAAVIALDRDGEVAASVVRSGRFSGRGALNACAKELAKKLAVLTH